MSVFEEIAFAKGACRRLIMSMITAIGLIRKTSFPRRRESRISGPLTFLLSVPFCVLLLPTLALFVFLPPAHAADIKADLTLATGYRVADLNWNIAGSSNNPNVLSELTWSDLQTLHIAVSGRALVGDWLYLRGSLGYGYTFSGDNQDSDYAGDNRSQEYSRSSNSGDGGSVLDAVIGAGYRFSLLSSRFKLAPLLGYRYSRQKLKQTDGVQVIATPAKGTPAAGPLRGLDSTYDASWLGPWLGFDLSFDMTERITLFGSFEYHRASFDAEGNLNLRSDLAHPKSYEHDADAKGFLITLGAEYHLSGPWAVNLSFNYQEWSTDPGVDRLYAANGSVQETRLNEVHWDSWSWMVGLVYRFGDKPVVSDQ